MSNELMHAPSFDRAHVDMIKEMYFKGSSDIEFEAFLHVCKRTGLDPALKQVYPVKRYDAKLKKETMTIQTSIDGYRLIAERTGKYAPGRESTYTYDKDNNLVSATSYVKKLTPDGTWHEVAATAYYQEYVQTFKNRETGVVSESQFWAKMPHLMLAKCAESLALRRAFPGDMSDIYTHEEMAQAEMAQADFEVVEKAAPKPQKTYEAKVEPPKALPPAQNPLTIADLLVAIEPHFLSSYGDLERSVEVIAEEFNTPPEKIIASAMKNETQLLRFVDRLKGLVISNPMPDPEAI